MTPTPYLFEWLNASKKEKWLRARDIRGMEIGETVELMLFDRNIGDSISNAIEAKKLALESSYTLLEILKQLPWNKAQFTKRSDTGGELKWSAKGGSGEKFSFDKLYAELKMWSPIKGKVRSDAYLGYRGPIIPVKKLRSSTKVKIGMNEDGWTFK